MQNNLAREEISDKDVKIFLEEIYSETKVLLNRANKNDLDSKAYIEDAENLSNICRNIAFKLEKNAPLTAKEKESLIKILLTEKSNIERGILKGVSTGIDNYIKHLTESANATVN